MMVVPAIRPEDADVKFARQFRHRFAAAIASVLSCFDRVIFKGYLPIRSDSQLNAWVDWSLRMRRKDVLPMLQEHSQSLVDLARETARQAGCPYEYRQGKFQKEEYSQERLRREGSTEGLVAVLCVQETCRTVKLKYGKTRPALGFAPRPQRVLYYYYQDPDFGLMYVRLETWFPYTIQVYVNGHDWLARQMRRRGIGFQQHDNAFTQLDDPEQAQQLADRFAQLGWVKQLTRWARRVNPHICAGGWLAGMDYYWVTEQAEYATDILFASRSQLRELYRRLVDHAAVSFSARDILSFLGRKLHGNFEGEVLSDCKKKREPGARVKHRMKENWLKMYDKFGLILRVETVINSPREFRVRRRRERNGEPRMVWCPMNKGVSNLPGYQRASRAANHAYIEALSTVPDPSASYQKVRDVAESKMSQGRRYAGFNPARTEDVRIFQALLCGDHLVQGFRNQDIRRELWQETNNRKERQRRANRVTRLLKRFHVRGLIAKIPRTRRWRVTRRGHQLLSSLIHLHYYGLSSAV